MGDELKSRLAGEKRKVFMVDGNRRLYTLLSSSYPHLRTDISMSLRRIFHNEILETAESIVSGTRFRREFLVAALAGEGEHELPSEKHYPQTPLHGKHGCTPRRHEQSLSKGVPGGVCGRGKGVATG